jgi:two-component system cell cycle sensor histidine kinase/response regulator CckA
MGRWRCVDLARTDERVDPWGVFPVEAAARPESDTRALDWREKLSRSLLRSSAALHLAGIVVYLIFAKAPVYAGIVVGLLTAALHFGLSQARGHIQRRGLLLCVTLLGEVGVLGGMLGWAPTVVLLALLGTVFGGLLLGRAGAYAMPVGVMVLMLCGSLAVRHGFRVDTHQYDLDDPQTWWRVAAMYTCLVAVTAWALRVALRLLMEAQEEAKLAVEREEAEVDEALRARSSRQQAEVMVRDAQKLQTVAQLSGGIAHLLNNTLTVVRGAAEQLRHPQDCDQIHEVARVVVDSVTRAARTTRDLLVFSRLEQPVAQPVVLRREIETLRSTLQESLPANIDLHLDIVDTLPVLAEPVRIRQLVLNLLLNARDAIAGEGSIRLGIQPVLVDNPVTISALEPLAPGPYVAITVVDSGHGMDARVRERACEPFFTTRNPAEHEGLGLFVVYGLVRQWRGALSIDSAEGQGTRVTVFLPATTELGTGADAAIPRVAARPSAGGAERTPSSVRLPPLVAPRLQLDAWKEPSLTNALFICVLAFAAATLSNLALSKVYDLAITTGTFAGTLVTAWAWRARRSSLGLRFAVLFGAIYFVVSLTILLNGYLTAAAIAALATLVLLAAVYLGRLGLPLSLGATVAPFLVASFGPIAGRWQDANVDPSMEKNWVRLAVLLPVVYLITSRMVLDLLQTVTRSIEARERSLGRLRRAREQRMAEDASLKWVQEVAAQTARLEAAGRVASTVAHDLNNALGAILGWASLIADDPEPTADDIAEAIKTFDESASFAATLVLQLQPHPITTSIPGEATDVGDLLVRNQSVLQQILRSQAELRLEATAGCFAPIRESELQRIVLNLATNARDAMPEGGCLTFRCDADAQTKTVRLEVSDTGMGMDEATQKRVFEAFFTTKSRTEGTGLGLHMVHRAVTDSGGRIELRSTPGKGSRFILHWPLAQAPSPRQAPERAPASIRRGLILLAEDNASVRGALVRGLERAGFEVVVAKDGTQACQQLSTRDDWGALCTDAIMPGTPSTDVIRAFRERFPRRPIVVCSGYLPKEVEQIVEAGGARFLAKPFGPSLLVDTLSAALAESEQDKR